MASSAEASLDVHDLEDGFAGVFVSDPYCMDPIISQDTVVSDSGEDASDAEEDSDEIVEPVQGDDRNVSEW